MVYSILSPWFWLAGLMFLVGFVISCYLPGAWWIRRFKRPYLEHILLSSILGIILWGIQGYVFGYLHLRWLSYGYLAVFLFSSLPHLQTEKHHWSSVLNRVRHLKRSDWPLIGLMLVGGSTQLIQVIGTGLRYGPGVALFRVNAYDGILHLSFIEALIRQFPPIQPGAIGLPITNYHYWSDLVIAELCRVWSLPASHSFFQFWPVILTTMTGLAVYVLIKKWGGSPGAAFWSLFFLYFGADAAYLIMLLAHQQWGFELAAIDNGATQFLNMPHGFAKMIFLTGLIPLTQWIKTRDVKWGILTVALLAPVVGFKIYFGMFASLGFGLSAAWQLLQIWRARPSSLFKELRVLFLLLFGYGVITLAIFLPPNQHAGGLFWSPLEWPKLFLGQDQIHIPEWWLRKQVYEAAGNTKAIVAMDLFAIAVCLISVYGSRLFGFLPNVRLYRQLPVGLLLFLIPGTFLFTFLGLYTLQRSGLFNVFNFFAVACVPLALFTGLWVSQLFESKNLWFKLLAVILIVTSLPRIGYHAYDAWSDQLAFHYDRLVTPGQLEALYFIRYQTPVESVVQSHINNHWDYNTPYVSFFSNRQTFLTGVGMMQTHNQPIEDRKKDLEFLFSETGSLNLSNKLKAQNIDYLFLLKNPEQDLHYPIEESNFKTVFENDEAVVYQPI
jgi:hypothetical protein